MGTSPRTDYLGIPWMGTYARTGYLRVGGYLQGPPDPCSWTYNLRYLGIICQKQVPVQRLNLSKWATTPDKFLKGSSQHV
jgi:hypothetical protein